MNLRQAAQQALEALEIGYDSAQAGADQYHTAMAGYRPERHAQMDADVQQIANAITALRAALAEHDRLAGIEAIEKDAGIHVSQQVEPEQEPVAWAVYDILHGGSKTLHWPEQHSPNGDSKQYKAVPLYTAPTPRKPLTDYINAAGINGADSPHMVVEKLQSAIERAHGIGGGE